MADYLINRPFCSDNFISLMKSSEVKKAGDQVPLLLKSIFIFLTFVAQLTSCYNEDLMSKVMDRLLSKNAFLRF